MTLRERSLAYRDRHGRRRGRVRVSNSQKTRDRILFYGGLLGLAFEMIARRPPDYGFLPILGGMVGLPQLLRRDRRNDDDEDNLEQSRES